MSKVQVFTALFPFLLCVNHAVTFKSSHHHGYKRVNDHKLRNLKFEVKLDDYSFDGSLHDLYEAANEKANKNNLTLTSAPTPSSLATKESAAPSDVLNVSPSRAPVKDTGVPTTRKTPIPSVVTSSFPSYSPSTVEETTSSPNKKTYSPFESKIPTPAKEKSPPTGSPTAKAPFTTSPAPIETRAPSFSEPQITGTPIKISQSPIKSPKPTHAKPSVQESTAPSTSAIPSSLTKIPMESKTSSPTKTTTIHPVKNHPESSWPSFGNSKTESEHPSVLTSVAPSGISVISESPLTRPLKTRLPTASSIIECDKPYNSIGDISFRYAIEYQANYSIKTLISQLEAGMNSYLASILLPCASSYTRRDLSDDYGIIALDSLPVDQIAKTAFCAATFEVNLCHVIEGNFRIFVSSEEKLDFAKFQVQVKVRDYLNSIKVMEGLYATTYLSPDIESPNKGNEKEIPSKTPTALGGEEVNTRSIVLFSFAGVAFATALGFAAWFRCSRGSSGNQNNGDSQDETKENLPPLPKIDTLEIDSFGEQDPLSPFSKMLPQAYRLDDCQADMSVILESHESSSINDRGSSILLSEGYSTEEGESDLDSSMLNFSSNTVAPVLGAFPRGEIQSLVDV